MAYWASNSTADRNALRPFLELGGTETQYFTGSPHPAQIEPEAYYLDQALLDRNGTKDIQLDIFYDYRTNLPQYPKFQEYFRTSDVPVLAVWGKNDVIFVPAGAEAFKKDVKKFELQFLDAGHFALETNENAMAQYMVNFFEKYNVFSKP
jgi:pimeloyl-ACP methyl ester carboxylesterase